MKNGIGIAAFYVAAVLGFSVFPTIAAPEARAVHQRCIAWTCASTSDDGVHVEFVDVTLDICNSAPLVGDKYRFKLRGRDLDYATDATEPAAYGGSCENLELRLDLDPDRTFVSGDRLCVEGIRLREGIEHSMGEPCLPLTEAEVSEPRPSVSPTFPLPTFPPRP
ncbi:hypothetical protein [Nocardia brasiliensis]|uniref:hypothetical protein n=1 Tax=Nocardia brasiliensis TaxID=37326 RepID=UPI002457DAE3|nr:hypothetical protein [Nocardia brasiliensis]